MKYSALLALALILSSACTHDSTRIMDQEEIDRIKDDLGIQACVSRIDSIGFEIEGMIYNESFSGNDRTVLEALPELLPACPVSGLEYIFEETESEITVTCPSGHGSLTIDK